MANQEHLARLRRGVKAWNRWRAAHPEIQPDLRQANLCEANLLRADLSYTDLSGANLSETNLRQANLFEADLRQANLSEADLRQANLSGADLLRVTLYKADLSEAILDGADFSRANLAKVTLCEASLRQANLYAVDLLSADLYKADLFGANLTEARLVEINFEGADLTGCRVYGIAVWNVNLVEAKQSDLVISRRHEPVITVDNLEVAQFIYLLLHNEKIRGVIDTITSKAVLILGHFTPERKAVLDAIREELRHHNYLPILFDFEKPVSRDFTETISTLAHMARFIIADLTEPSSLPKELEAIVPTLAVPVQPLLEGVTRPYSMFPDYWKYHWVLTVHHYENLDGLIASLRDKVIVPVEAKVRELEETRKAIAEELLKQRPV
jgi:uncharacterized protein YjbI with pentapeptide repeats